MHHLSSRNRLYFVLSAGLFLLLGGTAAEARTKRSAAIDAANAAKNEHSQQGGSASYRAPNTPTLERSSFRARVEMIPDDGTVVLRSEEGPGGGAWRARLDLRTIPLKAQSRRQFGGRRELVPEDLAVGQHLRITWRTGDGEILSIKVLKRG